MKEMTELNVVETGDRQASKDKWAEVTPTPLPSRFVIFGSVGPTEEDLCRGLVKGNLRTI